MRKYPLTGRIVVSGRVLGPCMLGCLHTASNLCQYQPIKKNKIIKNVTNFTPYTYREFSEAKIADLDVEVAVNEHIVTLDVPMDDSEVVHVLKHDRSVDGDLKPLT